VFDFAGSQAMQVSPPVPQVVMLRTRQVVPVQQPAAHEVASHTHCPETQRWPEAHAGPLPQLHAPPAQPSALAKSQGLQIAPPEPQAEIDGALQLFPTQHPLSQLAGSHAVPSGATGAERMHSPSSGSQRDSGGHCASFAQRV
jgi:hypothetical protein